MRLTKMHVLAVRVAPVAVVGLVVEDHDVLLVAEFPAYASDHLVRRFGERPVVSFSENRLRELSGRDRLAEFESVEVRSTEPFVSEAMALRLVLGRKNYNGSRPSRGTDTVANLYTLVQSAACSSPHAQHDRPPALGF